jgi:hypothetical protein
MMTNSKLLHERKDVEVVRQLILLEFVFLCYWRRTACLAIQQLQVRTDLEFRDEM